MQNILLNKDEEALIIATAEMKAQYGQGCSISSLDRELNIIIKELKDAGWSTDIKEKSVNWFARTVIKRVMNQELDRECNLNTRRYEEIKVSKLSHVRARACDPRHSLIIFHRICEMYRSAFIVKNKYILKLVNSQKSESESRCFDLTKEDAEVNVTDHDVNNWEDSEVNITDDDVNNKQDAEVVVTEPGVNRNKRKINIMNEKE